MNRAQCIEWLAPQLYRRGFRTTVTARGNRIIYNPTTSQDEWIGPSGWLQVSEEIWADLRGKPGWYARRKSLSKLLATMDGNSKHSKNAIRLALCKQLRAISEQEADKAWLKQRHEERTQQ